jgi:hypothetical protein
MGPSLQFGVLRDSLAFKNHHRRQQNKQTIVSEASMATLKPVEFHGDNF